jgi:quinol-cytochrome oxidoreductase complex cytochrome b subunit
VPILVRLYVAHVAIIPGLLTLHALLVKRHTISERPGRSDADEPTEPFTHHLPRIGALGVLAVLFPPGIGATLVEGIEVTKPPWMYWWMFTLENWIGLSGILWGTGTLFALLIAVPFIDRRPERRWRRRPIALSLGALVLIALVVLTVLEAVTTPAEHLGM